MVRTNCAVYGCYATSKNNKELKFHRFPQDERAQSWIAACHRPDLENKTPKQLYNMHVCSLHFEKWMYINKKLKDAALPSLNLPTTSPKEEIVAQSIEIAENSVRGIKTENDVSSPTDESPEPSTSAKPGQKKRRKKPISRMTNASKEVVFNIHQYYQKRKFDPQTWEYEVDLNIHKHVAKITGMSEKTVQKIVQARKASKPKPEPSDDSESQVTEVPVTVKVEVDEEYISEHEEDIMEKIESRKRMQEEDPIAVDAKKLRVELLPATESQPQTESQSQPQYVSFLPQQQQKCASHASQAQGKQLPDTSEPIVVPEFFMNVVVRNQNEILSILKKQVLLQEPDPELLTFLRFLGSKLLRYPKKKRDELQDRITEMLLLE